MRIIAGIDERSGQASRLSRLAGPLFLLLAAGLYSLLAVQAAPLGHDAFLSDRWAQGFAEALSRGEPYPRWLDGVNGGGSPVFFFYGPVFFWLAAPLQVLLGPWLGTGACLALASGILLFFSGLAMRTLLSRFTSPGWALCLATLYLFLPYRMAVDTWERGAYAELTAYLWLPLCFLMLERLGERSRAAPLLALCYAGFVASHLPTALLGSLLIGFRLLVGLFEPDKGRGWTFRAAVGLLLGLGLSALYLLPALTLLDVLNYEAWWEGKYRASQALIGGGTLSDDPRLPLLLPAVLAAWATVVAFAAVSLRSEGRLRAAGFWFAACVLAGFMTTAPAAPLWEHLPLLGKVQFPWRFFVVLEFAAIVLLALCLSDGAGLSRSSRTLALTAVGGLLSVSLLFGVLTAKPYFSERPPLAGGLSPEAFHRLLVAEGMGAPEYLPRKTAVNQRQAIDFAAATFAGGARFLGGASVPLARDGLTLRAEAESGSGGRLIFPRFDFPIWRVAVDGEPAASGIHRPYGFIAVDLPAGRHSVKIERRYLWQEKLGAALSLSALLAIAILLLRAPRRSFGG